MGQAARKASSTGKRARRGTHLRIVAPRRSRTTPARSSRARAAAHARSAFTLVVVLLVAVTVLGLTRVAVIARAAEMTIDADRLLTDIKVQRVEAGRLEVDRSSLSTPSRLESIAGASMGMARPASVRYIKLQPDNGSSAGESKVAGGTQERSSGGVPIGDVVGALVEMSAGEGQSLLLGDVGLAGTR